MEERIAVRTVLLLLPALLAGLFAAGCLFEPQLPPEPPAPPARDPTGLILDPALTDSRPFKAELPLPVEKRLKNGFRVFVLYEPNETQVTCRFCFPAGTSRAPADSTGLAEVAAELIAEAYPYDESYPPLRIALQPLGLSLQWTVLEDDVDWTLKGSPQQYRNMLHLMRRSIESFRPRGEALLRSRDRQKERARRERESLEFLAHLVGRSLVAAGTRHDRFDPTPAASLNRITPSVLQEWVEWRYSPRHGLLLVRGPIAVEQALMEATETLASWQSNEADRIRKPLEKPPEEPGEEEELRIYYGRRSGNRSAVTLVMTLPRRPGSVAYDELFFELLFGDGRTGRLPRELIDRYGWADSASVFLERYRDGAIAGVVFECEAGRTVRLVRDLIWIIRIITEDGLSAAALQEARNTLLNRFPLQAGTPRAREDLVLDRVRWECDASLWSRYRDQVAQVTPEEITDYARDVLEEANLILLVLGDIRRFEDEPDLYGEWHVYPLLAPEED